MKLFINERREKIMAILQKDKRITVKELALDMNVSEATLRTDLNDMELEGLLTRTHGGAILNMHPIEDTTFIAREQRNKNEKMKIANKAVDLINDGQCILLDASSTTLELARYLKNQDIRLTVITSGLNSALELNENPNISVILIGGQMTKGSATIEGSLGINILEQINIDLMFASANGFSFQKGLTDFNLYEVALKKEMVKSANKLVALIDHTKVGFNSSAVFANIKDIDVIISDYPFNFEHNNEHNIQFLQI